MRAGLSAAARRLLWQLPPETAHTAAKYLIKCQLKFERPADPRLATRLAGRTLSHPIGLAAGFDKSATMLKGLANLGFAFIEAGTVTPKPQLGNAKPRLFRLPLDNALINRFGFNNDGLDAFAGRLECRPRDIFVGANIGINKTSSLPMEDFALGLKRCQQLADYITINVSSPNTPGLRDLQDPEALSKLLEHLRQSVGITQPVFLKLAPDMADDQLIALADVALDHELAGLILCNTTIERPEYLQDPNRQEVGGLSGAPLRERSKAMLAIVAAHVRSRLELISAGGLSDGRDLFERLAAGANAVQIYTSFIYEGPELIVRMCREFLSIMDERGIGCVEDLIGSNISKA